MRPTFLTLGPMDRPEFRAVDEDLRRAGVVFWADDVSAAAEWLRSSDVAPVWIVFAQTFPGQWSTTDVSRLRCLAPLASIVYLLGSWCEGEWRSGTPVPGAVRLYWHQWNPRGREELRLLLEGRRGAWSLPPTAEPDEGVLAADRPVPTGGGGLLAIASDDPDLRALWVDASRQFGYIPETCPLEPAELETRCRGWLAEAVRPVGVVLDCREAEDLLPTVSALRAAIPDTAIVCLVGFPRVEQVERLRRAGATHVFSKPVSIPLLFAALRPLDRIER